MKTRAGSTFHPHISVKLNVNDLLFQKFVEGGGEEGQIVCLSLKKKL